MKKPSLIEVMAANLAKQTGSVPTILTDCCSGREALAYDKARQVFNTKFQFRPKAIFMVENADQVAAIVRFANQYPMEIRLRARSGGHDHEGESSGTDTWVIDFAKMNAVQYDAVASKAQGRNVVSIEPGAQFRRVKAEMDKMGLGIPHGTCETVCVAGFTMGGGWGPWTRRYGMACERLIGATIVLGDGTVLDVADSDPRSSQKGQLLWALRGGGGFSYGIVTRLVFDAFVLPPDARSFQVTFLGPDGRPDRPAIDILRDWERVIAGKNNPRLIGTNLMIVAANLAPKQKPDPKARLACTFNGYFTGSREEIHALIEDNFGKQYRDGIQIAEHVFQVPGADADSEPLLQRTRQWHFHGWDRRPKTAHAAQAVPNQDIHIDPDIELETEGPAPHKITSRLADAKGWNKMSRKALICALQSELVAPKQGNENSSDDFGMNQYITIGAITGPFYAGFRESKKALGVAFPYRKRPFTLQFQAWWDQYLNADGKPLVDPLEIERQNLANRPWVNRAEDWIEACRDADIPHTSGAFISFKDDAVKTDVYFAQSYDPLKGVKAACSEDHLLLFQTRKTII